MKINLVPIESIKPYEKNPRIHADVQIKRIAKSITDFGWTQPLVVDDGGTILAGHGRYAAALQLGIESVPVVNVTNLTEAQKKACRIIDNKLVTDSIWDDDLLQQELNDLIDLEYHLDDFGLDTLYGMKIDSVDDEWQGMPECENDNKLTPFSVRVNFNKIEDLHRFAELVGQRITENTKYIYYPEQKAMNMMEVNYKETE